MVALHLFRCRKTLAAAWVCRVTNLLSIHLVLVENNDDYRVRWIGLEDLSNHFVEIRVKLRQRLWDEVYRRPIQELLPALRFGVGGWRRADRGMGQVRERPARGLEVERGRVKAHQLRGVGVCRGVGRRRGVAAAKPNTSGHARDGFTITCSVKRPCASFGSKLSEVTK